MQLSQAIEAIEYKIATESDSFAAGRTLKMDIHSGWPSLVELSDAVGRKYPNVSLSYDHQANDIVQLLLVNSSAASGSS